MTSPAEPQSQPAGEPEPGTPRRALPFAIGGVAVLVAIVLYVLLARDNESNPVDDVSAALQSNAQLLAGPLNVTALQHTRCAKTDTPDEYTCTPVMDNADAKAVTVRYKDGTLTKVLGGLTLTEAPRTGDGVAKVLDLDEQASAGRTVKYGCAFTSSMNPDGSENAGSRGGYRCATAKPLPGSDEVLQRYVEFAPDGSVTRDFMITGG